jgi:hypothetical protein
VNSGKTLTFSDLFNEVKFVEIPIIQRDYAQGRESASDVREQFLHAIYDTLSQSFDELEQPLDLDFVYGSLEGDEQEKFSLLDGQQRLTTLFLLHWYLAYKEGNIKEFKQLLLNEGRSRFTYQTRPSSAEFFDALVSQSFDLTAVLTSDFPKNTILSKTIIDCKWFFLSWKLDPTIQSCLVVLDTIHSLFSESDGFYDRLTQKENPYITFQFLNLMDFGLSDELYIKMNARGKPLTAFENFKAWLLGYVDKQGFSQVPNDLDVKIDMEWTDIFWRMRKDKQIEVDPQYLKFFKMMALFRLSEKAELSGFRVNSKDERWINILRSSLYVSISQFEEMQCFDDELLKNLYKFLEYYRKFADVQEKALFNQLLDSSDYLTLTRFYALYAFISQLDNIDDWEQHHITELTNWLRLTRNLVINTRIDDSTNLVRAIQSLDNLASHSMSIYNALSTMDEREIVFFNRVQCKEEILKAKLILETLDWLPLFEQYENHSYFYGQIGFLLQYSKTGEDVYDQNKFNEYAKKASILFSDKLIETRDFLLQRAMLTFGDYLIDVGTARSFCLPASGSARVRDENWRKVFGNQTLKNLLDALGDDTIISLNDIISKAKVHDWRQYFISCPEAIKYCGQRVIHRQNDTIYLLTKSTMRSYHSELKTFVLNIELNRKASDIVLGSIVKNSNYIDVYGDDVPSISIRNWKEGYLSITYRGKFMVSYRDNENNVIEHDYKGVPDELITLMDEIDNLGV